MRVLVVSDVSLECVYGGAERMLSHHVRALIDAGVEVAVLTRQPNPDAGLVLKLDKGVIEHRLPFSGNKGLQGLLELRRSAKLWWELHQNYDVILAEQPFVMWGLLQAGCTLPRVQVCHSFAFEEYATRHGLEWGLSQQLVRWAMRRLEASVYRSATSSLVLSEFMKQRLNDFFNVNKQKICVAAAGVSAFEMDWALRDEQYELQWGSQVAGPVIVTLRNLVPRTGVDLLLQAAAIVHVDRPDISWKVIGEGDLLPSLKQLRSVLGMDDVVEFLGFMPEKDVHHYLWLADLFMLPTRALEGFGLVTLEANAYGLPVIATPAGANPDVVGWHEMNHVAEAVSPQALAKALLNYCDEMPKAEQRRDLSKSTLAHFAWKKHDDALLHALRNLG